MSRLVSAATGAGIPVQLSGSLRAFNDELPRAAVHQGVVAEVPKRRALRLPRTSALSPVSPNGDWGIEKQSQEGEWLPWGASMHSSVGVNPVLLALDGVRMTGIQRCAAGAACCCVAVRRRLKTCRMLGLWCAQLHSW